MSFSRLKETFLSLPKQLKFIGIGSLILAISTLLPWYADLDSYKIGDEFLGVTGPASFVGIVVLLMAGLSFMLFTYHVMGRRLPKLPVREGIVHLATAIESLFLLLVVNSIYFHPKFGVNITLKESRFGMIAAVLGSVLLLVGAYIKNSEELSREKGDGKLEPLITVPERAHDKITERVVSIPEKPTGSPISPRADVSTKGFLYGERRQSNIERMQHQEKIQKAIEERVAEQKPAGHQSSMPRSERPQAVDKSGYMIRLDL